MHHVIYMRYLIQPSTYVEADARTTIAILQMQHWDPERRSNGQEDRDWRPCHYDVLLFSFFLRFHLFIWERERAQGGEREKQATLQEGRPTQDSTPQPWDHDLSWRQTLNPLSHPGAPASFYF